MLRSKVSTAIAGCIAAVVTVFAFVVPPASAGASSGHNEPSARAQVAKKASFSCGGRSYDYGGIYFHLGGSGGRIGYMVGRSNGRIAVRMWRINGANASFLIAAPGEGVVPVAQNRYEHCSVLPPGASSAYLWAQIPGVGAWDQQVRVA